MPGTTELPISLVVHSVFCDRRAWIESVGETVDSSQIQAGLTAHSRVDNAGAEGPRRRSVDVRHIELGIVGRCDVVEVEREGLEIIEFKATPVRRVPEVTRANVIQLALQRLCLEDAGEVVVRQRIYFVNHRTYATVDLTEADLSEARYWVARTRETVDSATAPLPLVDDSRCGFCSHVQVCLPDEHQHEPHPRRIAVSNPNGEILHATTPGSRVSMSKGRVVVCKAREELASVPIERVAGLVVHGNVDVSSALMRELMWRGYSIVWCSGTGRVVGSARSSSGPNGLARVRQHVLADTGSLVLARELISSKVANQATQLRRNARDDVSGEVRQIRALARAIMSAESIPAIFGLEGDAASLYFGRFRTLIAPGADPVFTERWPGRVGRSAGDPLNALLNFGYGLLLGDTVRALLACGLDPHAGFVHSASRNKPALALDLMEQFRPIVADSVVLNAVNNGEVTATDLDGMFGVVRLTQTGRRVLTAAYQRRVNQEVTHPVFGYRVTWRRAIEVQARMLLGVLDGSGSKYAGIRTR